MQINSPAPVRWRTLVVALVVIGASLALLWTFIEPIYLENDDAAIRLTIAGQDLPGEPPTSYLVFTHEALARAAMELQRVLPAVPVWDLVLALALVAGVAVLCAFAWNAPSTPNWGRGAALVTVLAAVSPFITGLQFTISAVICAGTAVLLMVCELFWRERPRRSMLIAAGVLLLLGYAIRPMAAEGGALVILACFVPIAAARVPHRSRVVRLGAVGALLLGSFAVLDYADRALYPARDGWADHYTHTWQFVNLIDWSSASRDAQLDAIRAAAGWSQNDWKMLWAGWSGTDSTLFGLDPVARGYAVLSANRTPLDRARAAVAGFDVRVVVNLLRSLSSVAALALVLAIGLGNRRAVLLTCALLIELLIICVVVEAGFKELPFRLLAPLQACFVGVVIMGIAEHLRAYGRWAAAMTLAMALGLCAQTGWAAVRQARAEINHARSIEVQMAEVLSLNPSLVVLHADAFSLEHWWRPFHQPPVRFPMIRLGGNNGNPLLEHFLRTTGRPKLLVSICNDPSTLVIAWRPHLDLVTRYMEEHLGRTVTWEPAFEGSFSAWRCR